MENKNMTALISCFCRMYHSNNYSYKIYDDYLACKILTKNEYDEISNNMINGIKYFNPNFKGNDSEALRFIVDNQLSASILARSIFAEDAIKKEIKLGLRQYLVFASGYDTSIYRLKSDLATFELDRKEMLNDKKKRLSKANIDYSKTNFIDCDFTNSQFINSLLSSNYDKNLKSFCSLLGISYYLSKNEFEDMLRNISGIISDGSVIVFDYPTYNETENEIINQELASEAHEEMKSKYDFKELEYIASKNNLLIYKNFTAKDINNLYFYNYNTLNPNNKIVAPLGVNYCLMVKLNK